MNIDRFENEYYKRAFPDPQEMLKEFKLCKQCKGIIYYGDEILKLEDQYIHDDYYCLLKASGAIRVIAGEEEKWKGWP